MRTRVQKWGNSLAQRIPRSFAEQVGLAQDSTVEVSLRDGKLIVKPVVEPTFNLEQLLAQVREDNLHHEVDTGAAIGNETW